MVFKRALGGILAGLWLDFKWLGKGFGRFLGGIFKYSGGFWAIVVFSGLDSSHKPALQHLNTPAHVIFAGAPYCLLLLSSSLSSKSVLAFACWNSFWTSTLAGSFASFGLLSLALAAWAALAFFGLLWLVVVCFGLLWLAFACSGWLWFAQACFGFLWLALTCFGLLWLALACLGLLWLALACFGLLCFALACFGLLWFALACFGSLWLAFCLLCLPCATVESLIGNQW